MTKFLKPKYEKSDKGWRDELGACSKLSFGAVAADLPDLSDRVVLFRSRVRELRYNFGKDAKRVHRVFVAVTALTTAVGAAVLTGGIALSIFSYPSGNQASALPSAVAVLVGGLAALFAAGAGAFGLHKRYSAMFASQWAMKALETNIDVVIHNLAIGADGRDKLESHEIERLLRYLDAWLVTYTTALTSFGDKYGAAPGPVSLPEARAPAR